MIDGALLRRAWVALRRGRYDEAEESAWSVVVE